MYKDNGFAENFNHSYICQTYINTISIKKSNPTAVIDKGITWLCRYKRVKSKLQFI